MIKQTTIGTASAATMAVVTSSATKKKEKKPNNKPRRGRSLTVRDPRECTNAACNLNDGKRTAKTKQNQNHFGGEKSGDFSSGVVVAATTIDFTDRFAIFGNSTLALFASVLLLMVIVALTLVLEETNDSEGIIE